MLFDLLCPFIMALAYAYAGRTLPGTIYLKIIGGKLRLRDAKDEEGGSLADPLAALVMAAATYSQIGWWSMMAFGGFWLMVAIAPGWWFPFVKKMPEWFPAPNRREKIIIALKHSIGFNIKCSLVSAAYMLAAAGVDPINLVLRLTLPAIDQLNLWYLLIGPAVGLGYFIAAAIRYRDDGLGKLMAGFNLGLILTAVGLLW